MSNNYDETELSTKLGSLTVSGKAHPYSVWFILALRVMIGYAFLHSGFTKIIEGGFSAAGYLNNVAATNGNPLASMFAWMGSTQWFLEIINIAVPYGKLLIGIAVLIGLATRLAAFGGAMMMLLFYFGNWEISHGLINGDFAYMLIFLSVAAFGAGRIIGLDSLVEKHELIQKYPRLKYLLG